MAKNKATLPPDIAAAAADIPDYEDRRATPAPSRPDYVVEDDPILAVGDPRVVIPEPLDVARESVFEKDSPDAPIIEIARSADPMARLADSIEKLAARQAGPTPVDPSLLALLGGMMETMKALVQQQVAGSKDAADAIRKSQDPSNMFAPDCSVFNPRGERDYPRPKLKCRMFIPWEAEWESLTREEIELLNLLEPGDFFVKRNDESRILIEVKATINPNNGKFDRLLMNSETAMNNDYHWLLPPLRLWLRQILNQRPTTKAAASKVMTMEDELELIAQHGVDFEKVLALKAQAQEVKVG